MEGDIIPKRKIFGKLLFLLILTMGGVVYILLTFNKFLIEVGFFDDWFLYVILIFLLVTLIFLWIHMGLHVKIVYMISPMKEFYKKRKSILEEEKNKRLQVLGHDGFSAVCFSSSAGVFDKLVYFFIKFFSKVTCNIVSLSNIFYFCFYD